MAKKYKDYVTEIEQQSNPLKKKSIGAVDVNADAAIKLAQDTYNKTIDKTKTQYESAYERNAVQKLINEKQIAEKNANLGLTDSGLNRTQQTAAQLGYANQKGNIDLSRQQALDELSSGLAASITNINAQRELDKTNINQFYDQQNANIAMSLYNTDVQDEYNRWMVEYNAEKELELEKIRSDTEIAKANAQAEANAKAEIERIIAETNQKITEANQKIAEASAREAEAKAQKDELTKNANAQISQLQALLQANKGTSTIKTETESNASKPQVESSENAKKKQKIYWFRGVSDKTGNYLYYNDETGKNEEVPPHMNPYTSNDNRITYSAEYKDKNIGFFQLANGLTGYQPRGLVSEGGKFTAATSNGNVLKYDLYGNNKLNTVWKSKTNKYFIWDDLQNRYVDYTNEIKKAFPNVE